MAIHHFMSAEMTFSIKVREFDVSPQYFFSLKSLVVSWFDVKNGAESLISDDKWWENTHELWKPNELLYIATDEKVRHMERDWRR